MKAILARLLLLGFFLCPAGFGRWGAAWADDKPKATALGDKVAGSGSLRDVRGNRRALHDLRGNKALVALFVGTECPLSNLALPELIALEKKYRGKAVQFLAVYPNEADDFDRIASHAYDRDTPFLVLKDIGQKLADTLGVTRVPTVMVLDGNHVLSYRGRIDDRYSVAARRPKATRDDLVQAVEEVLAGKKVSVPETEADGCLIGRERNAGTVSGATYSKHVAPILQARCQVCHRPEQSAPFSLLTYEDAVRHARMIKEVTEQRRMPPWHADARYGHFAGNRRLTRAEIDTLAAWVDGGMPRGDARDLPKPVPWVKGWTHGAPDLVLEMPEAYDVPATGVVPYQNWIIDPKFTEDKWVQVAECRPGAAAVVHHIVAYIMKEGQRGPVSADGAWSILVGWAPGDLGLVLPPGTALRLPKGARLRLEMHYTPNGTPLKDRSAVGITFAKTPPKHELFQSEFANTNIAVAANDPHFKAEASFRLPADARLISLAPHMHYRGKHYFYEAIYPDGKKETLLSVPRWDFNWQNVYRFQEPVRLPKGTRLHSVAHWDNSTNNPLNPAPEKTVRFGLQSWEEMMVGFVSYVWERPETAAELAKTPPKQSDLFFDRFDVNGDGVLTTDEIPEKMKALAPLAGFKIPDKMTRDQFEKIYDEMRKRFKQPKIEPNPSNPQKKPAPANPQVSSQAQLRPGMEPRFSSLHEECRTRFAIVEFYASPGGCGMPETPHSSKSASSHRAAAKVSSAATVEKTRSVQAL
jgi:thiol-disulfide isomerase/thioredoxin